MVIFPRAQRQRSLLAKNGRPGPPLSVPIIFQSSRAAGHKRERRGEERERRERGEREERERGERSLPSENYVSVTVAAACNK